MQRTQRRASLLESRAVSDDVMSRWAYDVLISGQRPVRPLRKHVQQLNVRLLVQQACVKDLVATQLSRLLVANSYDLTC